MSPEIQENIDKYLIYEKNSTIFTTLEDYKKIKESEKIYIDGIGISKEFLKRALTDEIYYNYVRRYIYGDIWTLNIGYTEDGKKINEEMYCPSKSGIINGIEELISTKELNLTPEEYEKLEDLKKEISFEKFRNNQQDLVYSFSIDGIDYSIPFEKIISFLELPTPEFEESCKNEKIENIPKEHFAYAIDMLFQQSGGDRNYLLPKEMRKRLNDIRDFKIIDYQATNKFLETEPTYTAALNEDLEKEIMSDMPEDASNLEKAIYIYIKMCKTLTYSREYFAVNQRGDATLKYKDPDYISSITPDNNEVVCYMFNNMYANLLEKYLGVNYKNDYKHVGHKKYGSGHVSLKFRVDKFLITADSTLYILNSDLMLAKVNHPLKGMECINENEHTKQEFKEAFSKMYEVIKKNESIEEVESTEDLINYYKLISDNVEEIPLTEKISILTETINSIGLSVMDTFGYTLILNKILFDEKEREEKVDFKIISNKEVENFEAVPIGIYIINENGITNESDNNENIYFYFDPDNRNHPLVSITPEVLEEKIKESTFGQIGKRAINSTIPGIEERLGGKR